MIHVLYMLVWQPPHLVDKLYVGPGVRNSLSGVIIQTCHFLKCVMSSLLNASLQMPHPRCFESDYSDSKLITRITSSRMHVAQGGLFETWSLKEFRRTVKFSQRSQGYLHLAFSFLYLYYMNASTMLWGKIRTYIWWSCM